MLGEGVPGSPFRPIHVVTVLAVAFLTIASATAYLVEWVRHMASGPDMSPGATRIFAASSCSGLELSCSCSLPLGIHDPAALHSRNGACLPARPGRRLAGAARHFAASWATITIVVLTVLVLIAMALILMPLLFGQLASFLERLPSHVTQLRRSETASSRRVSDSSFAPGPQPEHRPDGLPAASWMATLVASIWRAARAVISIVSLIVVTPVVAFYLLYDWDHMLERLDALLRASTPRRSADFGRDINEAIAGFHPGQGAVCLSLGLFYAISLSLVGLNFGFLIGCVAGAISFIPFVGSIVGFVLAVAWRCAVLAELGMGAGRRRRLCGRPVHRRQHHCNRVSSVRVSASIPCG